MPWIDQSAMLMWADAQASVAEIEHAASRVELTLGPAAVWNKDRRVVDLVRERSGFRLNPVLCRVEEIIAAFEWREHGATHRTKSTPREACGPEMRTLFYDTPDVVTAVQLRLMPRDDERWIKVQGRDANDVHSLIRTLLREGLSPRRIWSELSTGWLSFCGGMTEASVLIVTDVAKARGLDVQASQAPRGLELLQSFTPVHRGWETLGPRDSLLLADPWAVLVTP